MPRGATRLLCSLFLIAGAACTASKTAVPDTAPRHLFVIVLDTVRADRLSLYGHDRPTTPFLESISDQLVVYEKAAAVGAWTVPNHASLFTGRPPALHQAQWGRMRLAPEEVTLAETLSEKGFCTEAWSANPLAGPKTGLDQGFDRFEVVTGPWPEKTEKILAAVPALAERISNRDCRTFVFLNWMDAHIPYNAHQFGQEFGATAPGPVRNARIKWEVSSGRRALTKDEVAGHRAAYDAAIRALDQALETLFRELDQAGLLDKSLVVVTSDHGDGLGDHQELGHSLSVWEEQLHVPLLVRFPRAEQGGTRITERHSLLSVAPALFDWMAVARPDHLKDTPGLDQLAPVLADYRSYFSEHRRGTNQNKTERYPELVATTPHQHVVYCDDHKLINRSDGTTLFFDLALDPLEQNNLAEQDNLAGELETELRLCLAEYRRILANALLTPFDLEVEAGEEPDLATLEALGYVQ